MPFEEAGRALSEDDMFSDPAGLVSAAIVILLWIFTCFCICSRDGGGESVPAQVAPSASTSEPEPKPEPEEPECKVLFISDVCGFGVPAGSSDIYVSFTLEGQNEVGKTAALANAAEPVWFGRPLISVPGDFKTGSLKVAIWEEDAKKGGAPICSAVVSLDVAELPKTFEKVDGKVSFKICTMGIEAALKLKAEAGKVIKAEKAKQEAEKQAKAKEAAKAKAAREKAAREAREKAAAAKAAAEAEAAAAEAAEAAAAAVAADEVEKERLLAEAAEKKAAREAAAAERAAAEAAALKAAEEQALQDAEYTLILTGVAAHGVPDCDAKPGSKSKGPKVDPCARPLSDSLPDSCLTPV